MGKQILFVDDEILIRNLVSLYFRRNGFAITTGGNRAELVRAFQATAFDVVILDIDLEEESGMELLSFCKQHDPQISVIMYTGLPDDGSLLKESMARGASGFLSKAQNLDALMAEVRRVLQPQAGEAKT